MAVGTVFIAYSHEDLRWEERVESHLRVLQQAIPGIEIWDDRRIGAGGDWLKEIEEAIARARVALLLVSDKFLTSEFVNRKEIPELLRRRAKDRLTVIPVIVRACAWGTIPWLKALEVRPPNGKPLAELRQKRDEAMAGLAEEVAAMFTENGSGGRSCASAPSLSTSSITPGDVCALDRFPVGKPLALPCFFPSVSGAAKSTLSPLDHLRVLVRFGYPCLLASIYDFANAERPERLEMGALVAEAMENGQIVLLDSGVYERKWLRDSKWSRSKFLSTLASIPCHLSFAYDKPRVRPRTTAAAEIVAQVLGDRRKSALGAVFPIVHSTPEALPQVAQEVANALDSAIIAVAERELGDGILAGARTMRALRRALNETGQYRVIHVLGTGNPLSLAVYSACGADSFDGLDWCQTVADHDSKRLYHNQQLDFFADKSRYAKETDLGYPARMLAHNLEFFGGWMGEIQRRRSEGTITELLRDTLPRAFCDRLMAVIDGASGEK